MGGGDLVMRKSWHPLVFKNQERVWLEEQMALALEETTKMDQPHSGREEEGQVQEPECRDLDDGKQDKMSSGWSHYPHREESRDRTRSQPRYEERRSRSPLLHRDPRSRYDDDDYGRGRRREEDRPLYERRMEREEPRGYSDDLQSRSPPPYDARHPRYDDERLYRLDSSSGPRRELPLGITSVSGRNAPSALSRSNATSETDRAAPLAVMPQNSEDTEAARLVGSADHRETGESKA